MKNQTNRTASITFFLLGGIGLAWGLYSILIASTIFMGLDGFAMGTIVGVRPGVVYIKGSGMAHAPQVAFMTKEGKEVTFTNPAASVKFQYSSIGQPVRVYYSTKNPERARTPAPTDGAIWFVLLGGGLFWVGRKLWKAGS